MYPNTRSDRVTYFDVFPSCIFKTRHRHQLPSVHMDVGVITRAPNTTKLFYSKTTQIADTHAQKKSYYESHPFYSLFFQQNDENVEKSDDENESVESLVEDDVVKQIDTNVIKVESTNVILDDWEHQIVWSQNSTKSKLPKVEKVRNPPLEKSDTFLQVNPWRIFSGSCPPKRLENTSTSMRWSLFPLENELLQKDCWESDVLWDEPQVSARKEIPLYLDLNDTGLLLTEAVVPADPDMSCEESVNTPMDIETDEAIKYKEDEKENIGINETFNTLEKSDLKDVFVKLEEKKEEKKLAALPGLGDTVTKLTSLPGLSEAPVLPPPMKDIMDEDETETDTFEKKEKDKSEKVEKSETKEKQKNDAKKEKSKKRKTKKDEKKDEKEDEENEEPKNENEEAKKDEKKKERKVWKIADEKLEDLSNDRYYFMGKTGYTQKKFIIYHSVPAAHLETFQTHLTMTDLQNFHRPLLSGRDTENMKIASIPVKLQNKRFNVNNTYVPQDTKELSSKDGKIHLIEYIEEFPPLLSEVGMGARIRNYCRREDELIVPDKFSTGEMVIVERGEESPFIGKVKSGKPVQSIDNKMTKTPIHESKVSTCDFLLIRNVEGDEWSIREIDHLFVAGQQQPQKDTEIPVPGSKAETLFVKERLETAIYLQFHQSTTLRISDFVYSFPLLTELTVRKILKKCATFNRKGNGNGGNWELKSDYKLMSEDDLFSKMTPERVCSYEAMMAGKMRLQDKEIELFKYSQLISAKQSFDVELKKRVEPLIEEVRIAPWTSMNVLAKEVKGTIQADFYVKDTDPRHLLEFYRRYIPKQTGTSKLNSEIKSRFGDLRKLTISQLRSALKNCGVNDERDLSKTRWELVNLLQKEVARGIGVNTEPVNGNRPVTNTASALKKQKKIKEIFEEQIEFITDENIVEEDEESDSEQETRKVIEGYLKAKRTVKEYIPRRKDALQQRSYRSQVTFHKKRIMDPTAEANKQKNRKDIRKCREQIRRMKKKELEATREKDMPPEVKVIEEDNVVFDAISGEEVVLKKTPMIEEKTEEKEISEKVEKPIQVKVEKEKKEVSKREKRRRERKEEVEKTIRGSSMEEDLTGEVTIGLQTYENYEKSERLREKSGVIVEKVEKTEKIEKMEKSKGGKDDLKSVLEKCTNEMKRNKLFSFFVQPVDTAAIKDYLSIVREPTDLNTIGKKVKKGEYLTLEDYLNDIEKLVNNCYRYNSRGMFMCATLIPYADLLYEFVLSYLAKNVSNKDCL
ncbi:transcription initiation factor tfiid, putative [Entamoeba invadens IP1]|uniref:Transcription initiation factor tfiid, putative n=1 Tax=Entamoeba invadens IP1 TaxID=370355 RepID=A0A0A1TVP0_ENTIV|nr:transcription initiation factor tfiid, putative [Entamoeba invadens IP1]ELP84471.1 transcription initiation factor tfiid, putative [Entamoeba invadens IP1]|eukprot:XP_004183817.1 transcription initiation factor tfiid, putative [Entamoeba invadens IP1]